LRPPNPANQKRQIAKIVANARRLFARHGYDRVSMDRLAAACRVTKPTLYYYFRDKRAVLLAVLQAHWMEQAAALKAFRPSPDLRTTLRGLANLVLDGTQRPENRDIIRIVLAEAGRHPEIGRAFFRVFGPVFDEQLFAPVGRLLGRRHPQPAVRALFHQYLGSLVHYSLLRQVFRASEKYLPGRRPYVDLLVDSLVRSTAPSASRRLSPR
jgi:AcrR family transcriptional regulator